MLSLLVYMVVTLLVVGLLLWAIDSMPWINADVKKMIHILVVVIAVLWLIGIIFPSIGTHFPGRHVAG